MKYSYILFILLFVVVACQIDKKSTSKIEVVTGETLAKQYCIACHMYPEPALLDKYTWANFVLIRMAAFMGVYINGSQYVGQIPNEWIEPGVGGKRIRDANIYPSEPILTIKEWELIRDFYLENAPEKLPTRNNHSDIKVGIPGFNARSFNVNNNILPLIQSIYHDPKSSKTYASQYTSGLFEFDQKGLVTDFVKSNALVVDMKIEDNKFMALDMATRYASDLPQGKLTISNSFSDYKTNTHITEYRDLMRPVHFDIDKDGNNQIVISEYGNLLGALNLYSTSNKKEKTTIFPDDGATKAEFVDIDSDGDTDIITLQANSDEGIDWYINDGAGNYQRERKLRFPPTHGSTHFSLVDFNNDGELDILYSNGDNGDYTPVLKPYHGIRLFINKGGSYQESFFLPQNGIYQSEAVDFDQDGDLDIIGVSFHPNFNDPKESFVYYQNNGKNQFKKFTIPQFSDSRWMRFITADIDNDHDIDILLTAMNIKTPDVPQHTAEQWQAENTAILLIENKLNN